MTRIKKGGCEYTVDDSVVDEYLAKGYSIIDARGNTVRTGSPTTYEALLTENAELRQAIKRLEQSNVMLATEGAESAKREASAAESIAALTAENDALRAENEELKKKPAKQKTAE